MTSRRLERAVISPTSCAVLEYTADVRPVGRCWFHLDDGICPRHGDVRAVQARYVATGELTREYDLPTWTGPRR